MTGPYEWNPMPHALDVRCPRCGGPARFEFAEVVRIRRREDVAFFEASPHFEYQRFDGGVHGRWHGASYFALLHGPAGGTIHGLPDGYLASEWEHASTLLRSRSDDVGAFACGRCGARGRHALAWPEDAWFRVDYRGEALWAFDRESARELRDYVASTDRDRSRYRWEAMLRHVPSHFLGAKARATVVARLDRILRAARFP